MCVKRYISVLLTFVFIASFFGAELADTKGKVAANTDTDSTISGNSKEFTGNVNLSLEGALDWKHFDADSDRKFGGNMISDISIIGEASSDRFLSDSKISYSWTDGTPNAAAESNTNGMHSGNAQTGGFSFTVPVTQDLGVLNVYGSIWGATGIFSATLDDGTPAYITEIDSGGIQNYYYNVQVSFRSETASTLTIEFITDSFYDTSWGNIAIHAATLYSVSKPVIILNGDKEMNLVKGNAYTEAGANAYDATGDISHLITTSGTVNHNQVGDYIITYNVSSNGVSADAVTRVIHVVPASVEISGQRIDGQKTVTVSGADPGAIIRLYDNTSFAVAEATADNSGTAKFDDNLTSITYRAAQVTDGFESELSDLCYFEPDLNQLPKPVLDEHPEWIELYNIAWELHKEKVKKSPANNGLTDYYADEGFDNNLYQWDILFMSLFNVYGFSEFPGIDTLDNFYRFQEDNGFICRVIDENNGGNGYGFTSASYNAVNPPLFAYAEWKYYEISGDKSRFSKEINGIPIIERLQKLFYFIKSTRTYADGTYHTNGQANGMDNTPGYNMGNLSWVDLAAQQAQSAYYIAKMAEVLGDTQTKQEFETEYNNIKTIINQKHWDSSDEFYYNLNQNNNSFFKEQDQRTPMGWWPIAANIADNTQAKTIIDKYIMNNSEFLRPMGISTLSKASSYYDASGNYWNGSVWAPTSGMTSIALKNYGYTNEAFQLAARYINALYKSYKEPNPPFVVYTNSGRKVYDRNNTYEPTLWEEYSAEYMQPGGIEEYNASGDLHLVRKDFVGWTGLGPISMLIEDVIGLVANAPENELTWNLKLTERNGMENFRFGENIVTLIAEERNTSDQKAQITVSSNNAFTLKVNIGGNIHTISIAAGTSSFEIGDGAAGEMAILSGNSQDAKSSKINLTSEGNIDWILWGENTERKDANQIINDYVSVGRDNKITKTKDNNIIFDATDGQSSEVITAGPKITNYGTGEGMEFTVPANKTLQILKVYVSVQEIDANINVEISDFSSPVYTSYVDAKNSEAEYRVYTFNFRAASDNEFLTFRITGGRNIYNSESGGVSIHAAVLGEVSAITVDYSELQNLIDICDDTYDNAVEGTGKGEYPPGSKSEFQNAINSAKIIVNKENVLQEEIDAAKFELQIALDAFNETKISTEPNSSEPNSSEPNSSEPNSSEPNSSEPNSSEPNSSEPNSSEPNSSEPNSSEPNSSSPSNPSTGDYFPTIATTFLTLALAVIILRIKVDI